MALIDTHTSAHTLMLFVLQCLQSPLILCEPSNFSPTWYKLRPKLAKFGTFLRTTNLACRHVPLSLHSISRCPLVGHTFFVGSVGENEHFKIWPANQALLRLPACPSKNDWAHITFLSLPCFGRACIYLCGKRKQREVPQWMIRGPVERSKLENAPADFPYIQHPR